MSEAAVNHYKADLRAIQFTLYEHLKVQQVFELEAFSHISRDECDATAAPREALRDRAPDARGATGDDDDFSLEFHASLSPPSRASTLSTISPASPR